ncbi:MAG TPA: hypothetical protein VKL40_01355 [Candidatus Angelobacter sp.]|nr:hypothetical protein [Candidatus Angelobacter sp.]
MRKVSIIGVVLGIMLGVMAAMVSGSWIFWLGTGLAVGVVVGSVVARLTLVREMRGGRLEQPRIVTR